MLGLFFIFIIIRQSFKGIISEQHQEISSNELILKRNPLPLFILYKYISETVSEVLPFFFNPSILFETSFAQMSN